MVRVPFIPWNLIHPWKLRRYGSCGQGIAHHCSDVMTDGLPSLDLLLNQTINGGASGERLDWSQTFEWEGLVGGALPILLMVSREIVCCRCCQLSRSAGMRERFWSHAASMPRKRSNPKDDRCCCCGQGFPSTHGGGAYWEMSVVPVPEGNGNEQPAYIRFLKPGPNNTHEAVYFDTFACKLCHLIFLSGTEAGGAKLLLMEVASVSLPS